MKLAEALQERADLNRRIEQLRYAAEESLSGVASLRLDSQIQDSLLSLRRSVEGGALAQAESEISQLRSLVLKRDYSRGDGTAAAAELAGEKPLEDPAALLEELESSFTRLEWLIARINLTNCAVKVEGRSLTELIARRDVLSLRADAYRRLVEEASQNTHRATRTEIKILSAVDVPALQRQADDASRELRLLDNTLQATNWTADLME